MNNKWNNFAFDNRQGQVPKLLTLILSVQWFIGLDIWLGC